MNSFEYWTLNIDNMKMKLRQAWKIVRACNEAEYRWSCLGEELRYRHTRKQWLQAQYVVSRHVNIRTPMNINGEVSIRSIGGMANAYLSKLVRQHGFKREKFE